MSQVITFYSYKGGVGRSLALVNVATLLSKWNKKVLMIDWDLEAPGLENFFAPYLQEMDWSKQKGVLDFLWAKQKKQPAPWQDWTISFSTKVSTTPLHLLVSGKSNGDYSDQLRAFNVSQFYKKHDGARVIEDFRKELLAAYDYILIDSRTGVTDFGGICTIQMPDILVMLLTATEQGLNGTAKIAEKAQAAHAALPFDREKLLIMPVPSRIDQSEYALTQEWLNKIATKLKPYYEDWIPAQIDVQEFMRLIKLPYIPYFSYGEKLPVIEQGVSDPAGLGYAYENLAMLVAKNLDDLETFMEDKASYLRSNVDAFGEHFVVDFLRVSNISKHPSQPTGTFESIQKLMEALKNNSDDLDTLLIDVLNLEVAEPYREQLKRLGDNYFFSAATIEKSEKSDPLYNGYINIRASIKIAFLSILMQILSEVTQRGLNQFKQQGLAANSTMQVLEKFQDDLRVHLSKQADASSNASK